MQLRLLTLDVRNSCYFNLREHRNFQLFTLLLGVQSLTYVVKAQYFSLIVGSGEQSLLLTAIFGAVKVVACGIFVLFFSERLSRREVLIGGAAFMAVCHITTAVVVKHFPAPSEGGHTVPPSGIATIALIYLFVIAYNFSWGPLPWYVVFNVSFSPILGALGGFAPCRFNQRDDG